MPILKHIVKKDTSVLLDIKKYFTILLKNDLLFYAASQSIEMHLRFFYHIL